MSDELKAALERLENAAEVHCVNICGDEFERGEESNVIDRILAVTLYLEETV